MPGSLPQVATGRGQVRSTTRRKSTHHTASMYICTVSGPAAAQCKKNHGKRQKAGAGPRPVFARTWFSRASIWNRTSSSARRRKTLAARTNPAGNQPDPDSLSTRCRAAAFEMSYQASTSLITQAFCTPVNFKSRPCCLTVSRSWSMPIRCRIVAFKSRMCTAPS